MDINDVELVENKKGGRRSQESFDDEDDGVVAADGLRNHEAKRAPPPKSTISSEIAAHPEMLLRNRPFLLALVAMIIGLAVVVGSFYIENDPIVEDGEMMYNSGGEMGEQGVVVSPDKMSEATGQLPSAKHKGKDWAKHHANKHNNGPPPSPPPQDDEDSSAAAGAGAGAGEIDQEVLNWQAATVSLADGKKYEVVKQMQHDSKAFVEGLTYFDGRLFESTGMNGQSELRELDPETGAIMMSIPMDRKYFGEGLTYYNGTLIQLSWQMKTGFIYQLSNLNDPPKTFKFSTTNDEGWGLTYDPVRHELIESDGSSNLHIWDPDTLEQIRVVPVTRLSGQPAIKMNELEYWRGKILANVWYQDSLIVIDHVTGAVEKEYDFSDLYPKAQRRRDGADVLNGISVSEDPNLIYMTGKYWDRMFLIRLLY